MQERLQALGFGRCRQQLIALVGLLATFAAIATPAYLACELGAWSPTLFDSPSNLLLVAGFFFLPSLPEELLWRWLLIPPAAFTSRRVAAASILASTVLFTAAHPLAAWLFVPHAWGTFTHPAFLTIVFLLGLTCGTTYVLSRSLWPPVVIHWLTVVAWKFFLGGPFVLLGR